MTGRVAGHVLLCRCARHVAALCRTRCCRVTTQRPLPLFVIQKLYRDIELMSRTVSQAPRSRYKKLYSDSIPAARTVCCVVALCCARTLLVVSRPKRLPPVTIQNLYRDLPQRPDHGQARAGRPCSGASWPYSHGRVAASCCALAPARSYHGLTSLLCHDTICCIVTKTEKWEVAHPAACNPFFFFHSLFFFSLFQLLQDHNIYIYIYIYIYIFMSSIEQNKFI